MKRDLFVFAGQSNMMGASVFPPQDSLHIEDSYEYKHNIRRLGKEENPFVKADYPVGEFSYMDLKKAYGEAMVDAKGKSRLCDYINNTYFCPAMSSLKSKEEKEEFVFSSFSESTAQNGVTLAPFLAQEWERLGNACAYAHIAKGGVSIDYYMTPDMVEEYARRIARYNSENGKNYDPYIPEAYRMSGAAEYFLKKCRDFFADAKKYFGNDDLSNKCFFWLQGESDANRSDIEYETKLEILWDQLKTIGFTHFFCIRVDFFGAPGIYKVMKAQESFVSRHDDAYMLTRSASYFTYPGQNEDEWFTAPPAKEYRDCRDSFFGFRNNHINEKGFEVIAERAAKNLYRVLVQEEAPLLEEEMIKMLLEREDQNV